MKIQLNDTYQLRDWREDDEEAMLKYADDRDVWINLTDKFPHPYTRESWEHFFKKIPETKDIYLAVADHQEAVGGMGLHFLNDVKQKTARIGYWLGKPFWGKGIAPLGARALIQYGFHHFDIQRIQAEAFGWNPRSRRVLEKSGFTFEARLKSAIFKDNQFTDEYIYVVFRHEIIPSDG